MERTEGEERNGEGREGGSDHVPLPSPPPPYCTVKKNARTIFLVLRSYITN